ncbi:CG5835 [Drosophila busckii]|uniref:CG5835 n=1 Tax=Drosophila busckii TaxID=30019 RepID=A0A0M4ERB0_DROBS|nr:uncharacterized protein LOC108602294 [Drosophila busckii]ALC47676.1 CG5835 [Drosophila busckii]
MRVNQTMIFCNLLLVVLLTVCSHAKPLEDLNSATASEGSKNKTAVSAGEELNTATNLVLAENYKYDVEILESGADEKAEIDSSEELEERFKGHGIYNTDTDTFAAENIEMTPAAQTSAFSENHLVLSVVIIVLALLSICLYAGLVIWRSHLEQRYGMRERLVNRDLEEEGVDDTDHHVRHPHTLSPYAPTTTPATTRS